MLITNGNVVTMGQVNTIIVDGAVLVRDGRVVEVDQRSLLEGKYPNEPRLDAEGQLIMPGAICAHTHFYGAFARGLYIPGESARDFPEILAKLWWKLDKALDEEGVRYSALALLADAIRNGCTTLIDHHASPNTIDGSLDIIAEAVKQSGLRACLCYEVTDRDGADKARAGIRENERFLSRVAQETGWPVGMSASSFEANDPELPPRQLAATFGLHASLTLSDETLERCAAVNPGGYHIHVAEHPVDEEDSLRKSGHRIAQRLQHAGILGHNTIAAHCVHVDAWEMGLLRETGTWITHQPRSNMNNAVGAAPVETLLHGGVPVCLGTDGFSHSMWDEMKAAYLLHKIWHLDPRRMDGAAVTRMAYENNGRLASRFFGAPLGELTPGAAADIVFLDYQPFTPLSSDNLPWHVLFGIDSLHVTTTICAGQVLMRNRQLLTLDEAAIAGHSRKVAKATWERYWDSF